MRLRELFLPPRSETGKPVPLRQWLWLSYVRSAVIPLLVIELSFLLIYWVSHSMTYQANIAAIGETSHDLLSEVSQREATAIGNGLAGISQTTDLLARQTLHALDGAYDPPAAEKKRYLRRPDGGLVTRYDNGTTASFYSNRTPIGPEQMRKVWHLAALDPLIMGIQRSNRDVASVYVNTFDSYNRIYPYFDAASQYPPDMDIPSYNFYYDADAAHNPSRQPVWTDAYVDPAGHGWMVSSIAPVWRGDKLEGVVGLDVTLKTIIDRLAKQNLPWGAYAVLVDRQGRIIAMPPAGERDFRLRELTDHRYSDRIRADRFKPESFDLRKRPETRELAAAMATAAQGWAEIRFPHSRGRQSETFSAAFSTIPGPGWHLVVIAPQARIFAQADTLRSKLRIVGLIMLGSLIAFYAAFLAFLFHKASTMSASVAKPLQDFTQGIERIGEEDFQQSFDGSTIAELDVLGQRIVHTASQLDEARARILEQEREVAKALERQRQTNEEMTRFIHVISHEVRTPLSIISSGAQILDRKADVLEPQDIRTRADKFRNAVKRMAGLLDTLVGSLSPFAESQNALAPEPIRLREFVRTVVREICPDERITFDFPQHDLLVDHGPAWGIAIRTVIDNAVRYSPPGSAITVTLRQNLVSGQAELTITDQGHGIGAHELDRVGERFFRGEASIGTEGAGLGLFVARIVARDAGGSLAIQSDGKGTQAVLTMPLAQQGKPA